MFSLFPDYFLYSSVSSGFTPCSEAKRNKSEGLFCRKKEFSEAEKPLLFQENSF